MPAQMGEKDHRPSTIEFHAYLLKVILPFLGTKRLKDITPRHIQQYLDYLKNSYKTKNNQPLSPKTIRHHYCTLNLIFEYAERIEYIAFNPLKKVSIPKLVRHKVDALTKEESLLFIKELNELPLRLQTLYAVLLMTGLRRGECFGLQWKDIDFQNATMCIERSVTYTKSKGVVVGLPKTDDGVREIPITDYLLNLLTKYQTEQQTNGNIDPTMYLFHSPDSFFQPQNPTYITKHMRKFMLRIGLPNMSPHDLRHTCATLLIQSGADIKSVQDMLGHADASITLNFYVRSSIENMRAATKQAFNL